MDATQRQSCRQYYVAVSDESLKLPTLVDLLQALLASGPLGLTVSCSSRDSLDDVVGGIRASVPQAEVAVLHSDLLEEEVQEAVAAFDARAQRLQQTEAPAAPEAEGQAGAPCAGAPPDILAQVLYGEEPAAPVPTPEQQSDPASTEAEEAAPALPQAQVLATTDELFRRLDPGFLPAASQLLVCFDLPARKETYARQLQALAAAGGKGGGRRIVVFFVAAGQVPAFRAVEGWAGTPIAVMPVHAGDIFGPVAA